MEMEVDIIEFRVPTENNKTLFVWDILPEHSEAHIYVSVPCIDIRPFLLISVVLCINLTDIIVL